VEDLLPERKPHQVWIEQCEAAQTIRARFGLKAAFDYIVGEKLPNFAEAAANYGDFARELPRFVSEVRQLFAPDEIAVIARVSCRVERDAAASLIRKRALPRATRQVSGVPIAESTAVQQTTCKIMII
jgi:hypothetical protein